MIYYFWLRNSLIISSKFHQIAILEIFESKRNTSWNTCVYSLFRKLMWIDDVRITRWSRDYDSLPTSFKNDLTFNSFSKITPYSFGLELVFVVSNEELTRLVLRQQARDTATHFSHFKCIFYGARKHNERNLALSKQITIRAADVHNSDCCIRTHYRKDLNALRYFLFILNLTLTP